jgi:DNA-binding transcriptional regulator YiaG
MSTFKNWRDQVRLTQEQACRAIGVTLRTVQHWEKGTIAIPEYALRLMTAISTGADTTPWKEEAAPRSPTSTKSSA